MRLGRVGPSRILAVYDWALFNPVDPAMQLVKTNSVNRFSIIIKFNAKHRIQ